MFKIIKIIMAISMAFVLANGIIHFMLFIYSFNYPNILASICFYALIATWLVSFLITNTEERGIDNCINFIQKTKAFFVPFVIMGIYVGIIGLWGLIKYQLTYISFLQPITPERAKIVSAGFTLFFYLPIWILYPLTKMKKEPEHNNAFNPDAE